MTIKLDPAKPLSMEVVEEMATGFLPKRNACKNVVVRLDCRHVTNFRIFIYKTVKHIFFKIKVIFLTIAIIIVINNNIIIEKKRFIL